MHRGPSGGKRSVMNDGTADAGSETVAFALAVEQAQRKQCEERRSPAQVVTVLAIEGTGVQTRVGRGFVALGAARAAAARAFPAHRLAFAREAEAMAKEATAKHHGRDYSDHLTGRRA